MNIEQNFKHETLHISITCKSIVKKLIELLNVQE